MVMRTSSRSGRWTRSAALRRPRSRRGGAVDEGPSDMARRRRVNRT